ncbi:prenyltransferase/squalene oxidase repeat-containing protein [Lacipirellula sp.]|uniref:prenyltransferase/squalene oxidase repeat-containing protein n=1 Tax=Lacipirellula sp. TaxID=2691419 RepID=UPI003D0F6DF4
MSADRRWGIVATATRLAWLVALLPLADRLQAAPPIAASATKINAAINRGAGWLVAQQHPDGAWRSTSYTQLNAGPGATALAAATLAELNTRGPEASAPGAPPQAALGPALSYLLKNLAPAGHVRDASGADEYPTYATALTLIALNQLPAAEREPHAAAIRKMQAYLVAAQVTQPLPNKLATADDVGGWGLVGGDPTDPSSFRTSNVSTTRFALEALQPVAAEHPETFARAKAFLARRQQADGGFAFLSDPLDQLNKAGANDPADDKAPFIARSYGTTTADGLLALRACGLADDDPHVAAAIAWLNAHPNVDAVPGFAADEVSTAMADGLYYYYAASLVHAMAAYPEADFGRQSHALANELLYRQRDDGTWANLASTMREDDPLVATTLALNALAALSKNQPEAETNPANQRE